jgi:hypothetical protein
MNVFISGSICINELPDSAVKKIDNIISKNFIVLIGDAKGVDLLVQKYLSEKNYNNVIIYSAGAEVRNNVGNWEVKKISNGGNKKGRALYTLKDIAMAEDSDYGLMIWDGQSLGTLNNIKKMKNSNKRFFVILNGRIIDEKNIDTLIVKQVERNNLQLDLVP